MCGIFGAYALSEKIKINKNIVEQSIQTLNHRGPNCRKVKMIDDYSLAFAHTRLSIIDFSESANQPMQIGKYWIIYNGEIFNYIELREQLKTEGYFFHSKSDTEVLLNAYDKWGENCVDKFNGMWAFSIFDTENRKLFCSRDRFGVKPFNYYFDDDIFIFGSEIKAILSYAPNLSKPNYNSIALFAREGICGEIEDTWFENVKRLMPGHNLIINEGKITIKKYYHYPTETRKISFEEAKKEFYNLFVDSVKIRMRSDVPIGTTLSGGLDSSSIVSALRTFNKEKHNTFTAHFPTFKNDEHVVAEKTNKNLSLTGNPTTIDFDDNYLETLKHIIFHLESGHPSPSVFPLWKIYEESRKKVIVVLEGQGADEAFGGYISSNAAVFLIEQLGKGNVRNFIRQFKLIQKNYGLRNSITLATRIYSPTKIREYLRHYILRTEGIFSGYLRHYNYSTQVKNHSKSLLINHLENQHQTTLVNLLHYGDALSMAFSLESRLPFMDYRLVNFAFTLPPEYLINNGKGKFIIREALKDILPKHIYEDYKKLGFPSPVDKFFRDNKGLLKKILLSDTSRKRNLYNFEKLKKLIDRVGEKHSTERLIFRLLCIEIWFEMFIDNKNKQ